MITIAILAIMAVVAVASYKKYVFRAQAEEGKNLLMDLKAKQEQYFSTYSQYVSTATNETAVYPTQNALAAGGAALKNMWRWDKLSCTATPPPTDVGWCHLGFQPSQATFFQLVSIAWNPKQTLKPSSSQFQLVKGLDATRRWYYGLAFADMDVDGKKSTFIMTSQHNEIIAIDETE